MSIDDKENIPGIANLRQDLKQWEKAFITANNGRKPGRDDIKKDAAIAAKYKEYDRLRRPPKRPKSPQIEPAQQQDESRTLQERPVNVVALTPRRTPSKRRFLIPDGATLSPVQEIESTPAFIRCALGPTPQKDGQVLGIFDMLSAGTPSKYDRLPAEVVTTRVAIPGTPSKSAPSAGLTLSRTPQSASKRFYLDSFAGTPLKRKREEEECPNTDKRKYATPSFLRRSFPMGKIDEDTAEPEVHAPLFKKRGLVRSLSTIIQDLRKQESERMDEEWDILNEMEDEEQLPRNSKANPNVAVQDSQVAEMPLGPDQIQVSDDEASDAGGQASFRKPWKKKGLKRQTRRVIMRPVTHKPGKAEDLTIVEESEEEECKEKSVADGDNLGDKDDDDSDYDGTNTGDELDRADKSKKATSKAKPSSTVPADKEGNILSKGVRKISAQAHANFRKLKIKNKNSKANGRGRRFGRR